MNGPNSQPSVLVLVSAALTRPVLLDIAQASGRAPIVIHDASLYSGLLQDVGRNDIVLDFLEPGSVGSGHKRHLADVKDAVPAPSFGADYGDATRSSQIFVRWLASGTGQPSSN